jgi:DNA-binding NtrC family response regulator
VPVAPVASMPTVTEVAFQASATPALAGSAVPAPAAVAPDSPLLSLSFDLPLREARDAFERAYFEHHLKRENGSMTRVAEKTGLERTHLYRKLKQLGVEPGKAARKA